MENEQSFRDGTQREEPDVEIFNPNWRFHAAFAALAVTNLTAALDATMLSVAIPVSSTKEQAEKHQLKLWCYS